MEPKGYVKEVKSFEELKVLLKENKKVRLNNFG
jgi:hypothetical protein